ncbi:MAG: glycosyl hydrolase [Bacteroidetes bacterium]|nr:MAG: glycosyl hydrolase [Bacteroidota bacterium]
MLSASLRHGLLAAVFSLLAAIPALLPAQSQTAAFADAVQSLRLRSIGPAVMGGRIADIAVSPADASTWYVAAGSGNLWKTSNRGLTWTPVFDDQPSFSIGAVTLDPQQPETVWVGTGENVSGRHVGWGDGIYRSRNGGQSWEHLGLARSEHIGKILIDPRDSDHILVAAEGPLWAAGGQRGVYQSTDGGQTWTHTLNIDAHTGVTDLEFVPGNPDIVYAAAYQRRRHTWSLLAGGPQSGIYKSTDGGASWRRLKNGLPAGDMGKIGLAVTPADPSRVYATIEAQDDEKGLYASLDQGESWEKRNSYISSGTGPHYYQELYASPHDPELIYQMDVFLHVSRDGGRTFDYLESGRNKHSDNHAFWIDPQDGRHLLAGTDGGLYESFDEGKNWRHFPNLPISQFYKLGLDNSAPFYHILGGAQDLGTLLGPARTGHTEGIRNQDWYVPLGADGYDSHFDPEDPNILYLEYQQGELHRYDRRTEEALNIQPQPDPSDPPERWNWDSPILISPHNHERIYFGSQRLWRSDHRGDAWTPISPDLTTNTNRYELELIDRVWSVDALYDNGAMSKYATLTAIAESPQVEGLLYTGSDDGLIHVSEDGGKSWRQAASLPGVPARAFINDIEASPHDPNTVFAAADAHKLGDFRPYLFISTDRGRSWRSLTQNLPAQTIVWVLKQDPKAENLLFAGTEYGLYVSPDLGRNWCKLSDGVPTIPFRDLELQPREDDLVGATFGRGFYVLDDYSCLRSLSQALADQEEATLFPVRDSWWYIPQVPMQAQGMPSQGSDAYRGENPPFGALITYYLPTLTQSPEQQRKTVEDSLRAAGTDTPFPGWEALWEESLAAAPQVRLLIRDARGTPIRWLEGPAEAGLHRLTWDLRLPAPDPISLSQPAFQPPWVTDPEGPLVAPGRYSVELYVFDGDSLRAQGAPQAFRLKPIPTEGEALDYAAVAAFQAETQALSRDLAAASRRLDEAANRLRYLQAALKETPQAGASQLQQWQALHQQRAELARRLQGDPIRQGLEEATQPGLQGRVQQIVYGHWPTTQPPTQTQRDQLNLVDRDFEGFRSELQTFWERLAAYEAELAALGAPYTPGRVN